MSRVPLVDDKTDCQRWNVPDFGGSVALTGDSRRGAAGETGETQKLDYEGGFEQGHREGLESGRQEVLAQVQRLEQLMGGLARPFEELDHEVEDGLVALAFAIARQLIKVEIKTSPEQIVSVINEAVALLPGASRDVLLHLHPEDVQLLQELSPGIEGENKWRIIEDTSMQRGGCMVKTRASQIDATVEARLENIIASLHHVENSEEVTS